MSTSATTPVLPLEKANSAKVHLARMGKAVADFHSKMGDLHKAHMDKVVALHKAHADDMQACMKTLHKILGVEETGEAGDKPESVNLTAAGTESLVTAAAPTGGLTKADLDNALAKQAELHKADMLEMLKACFGDESTEGAPAAAQSLVAPGATVVKAAGVGSPSLVQRPVAGSSIPVRKGEEHNPTPGAVTAQATEITPDLVQKAVNGDAEAAKQLMKGTKAAELPTVLYEAVAKIH